MRKLTTVTWYTQTLSAYRESNPVPRCEVRELHRLDHLALDSLAGIIIAVCTEAPGFDSQRER